MAVTITRSGKLEKAVSVNVEPSDGWSAEKAKLVKISFYIPVAGRGTSEFEVSIPPEDFKLIAQAMMNANSDATIKAFGSAMIRGKDQIFDADGNVLPGLL